MKKLLLSIFAIISTFFIIQNVNAKSNVYFSKSVSTIGGKNFGNADNWVGLPASTSTDYAVNLTFSFDYSSGYENTIPYNVGDKINVLLTSCVANDHKFTNVYPYTKNYLGVSYISNEYCGFNWSSNNNHVQYTLLQLNVSNTYDDDVESSSGSILIKHFEVKNVNLSIYNSNSWADAVYFINAEVLDNTEYANLLNQYKQLDATDKSNKNSEDIKNTTDDIKGSLNDDSIDTSQSDSFFDGFNNEDNLLTSVVLFPIQILNNVDATCTPLTLPFESDKMKANDYSLPCGDTLFWNKPKVAEFKKFWNFIVGAPIIYGCLLWSFKTIQKLKNPFDNEVEMIEL